MNHNALHEPAFINGANNRYFADVAAGWLSIKSMFGGEAVYRLENGRLTVNDDNYLVLNDQQPYTITIDSPKRVESFCIFFPTSWASDVLRQYLSSLNRRLDDPAKTKKIGFYNVTHRHDSAVTPHLLTLRRVYRLGNADPLWETEQLYRLLDGIVRMQKDVHLEMSKLPAARRATRQELYRRLEQGRAYLHDHFRDAISLREVATAVHLSPYHFARSFKQLYGQTPHGYLTDLRLEAAKSMLHATDESITDICLAVGFRSIGSFGTLFQRKVGRSPTDYRRQTFDT